MPINLTRDEIAKEKAEHTRLLLQTEKRAVTKIRSLFKVLADTAADIYEVTGSINDVVISLTGHSLTIERVLTEQYKHTANIFSKRIFDAVNNKFNVTKLEHKQVQEDFEQLLEQWVTTESFKQSETIAETTRKQIVETILAAQAVNSDTQVISKIIRDTMGTQIARERADLIARTETHNAATFASLQSTKIVNEDLGLGLKKVWAAVDDARTRPDHNVADNQKVEINADFIVGGTRMSRPGDPRGGAKQVIRCRCALIYED